jgi:hypothetical protein
MARLLLMLCLFAPALAAEYESNFGRVILGQADVIVQGVASAKRTRVGTAFRAELTIEQTLYGKAAKAETSFLYNEEKLLPEEAARGLYALKAVADGSYSLVGKPVLTPHGDPEERDKLTVARDFITLEEAAEGDERTGDFFEILKRHVKHGGYPAQNAAVELMFVARDRGSTITEARFDTLIAARREGLARLTEGTRKDLELAFQGMVEARVKSIKFRHTRRGKDKEARRAGADDLIALQIDYPRAFTEEDAKLAVAIGSASEDVIVKDKLKTLAKSIRDEIRRHEAEKARKEKEARERIRHAEED